MDSAGSLPRSRSRRSVPSLQKLNIAPLSSTDFPLDTTSLSPTDPDASSTIPHASYIQGRSAPTTPGILSLSRNTSRHRRHRSSRQGLMGEDLSYFSSTTPTSPTGEESQDPHSGSHRDAAATSASSSTATTSFAIPKAKSSSALLSAPRTSSSRKNHSIRPLHEYTGSPTRKPRHHKRTPSTDWLHRAGLVIASEARDAKGQSWLVRRESSTSVAHMADEKLAQGEQEYIHSHGHHPYARRNSLDPLSVVSSRGAADDERGFGSPLTPRWPASVAGSRAGSRLQSRRGSRVGSRVDIAALMTPRDDYYDIADGRASPSGPGMEPDFVDGEEGEESADELDGLDEEEIARLARERGFGLGGWMDKLVSWTLFKVAEDGEESDAEADDEDEGVRRKRIQEYVVERSRVKPEPIDGKENLAPDATPVKVQEPEEEGGWKDAAWLLSVASKVLF